MSPSVQHEYLLYANPDLLWRWLFSQILCSLVAASLLGKIDSAAAGSTRDGIDLPSFFQAENVKREQIPFIIALNWQKCNNFVTEQY